MKDHAYIYYDTHFLAKINVLSLHALFEDSSMITAWSWKKRIFDIGASMTNYVISYNNMNNILCTKSSVEPIIVSHLIVELEQCPSS